MLRSTFRSLLCTVLLIIHASFGAVIFQSIDALPPGIEYDFIVAGGGVGGSLVATRLAQNQKWNVLVVEAGASNEDFWETRVPGFWPLLGKTAMDWNYTTVPQPGLNNRAVDYSRAKVLGGCSSHNAMIYTRGSKSEWNQYAEVTGNKGLKWNSVLPLLMKAEKWGQSPNASSNTGHYNPAFHGKGGELLTQAPYSIHPFNDMLMQSSKELPDEFPFDEDWSDGTPIGTSAISPEAERSSAATAFLGNTGKNVHVLLHTQVTRVLPTTSHGTEFRIIEVGSGPGSKLRQIKAKREVILSSGIFGTPQILQNSGIGKQSDLDAAGVRTIVDNPSVGKNLSDHVSAFATFSTNIAVTTYNQTVALQEWNTTRTGPLTRSFQLNHMSFIRLPEDSPPFTTEGFSDPTSGKDTPHVEFTFFAIGSPDPANGVVNATVQVYVINLHPISRGSVTIKSSDPFEYPSIDVGLLAEKMDMSVLREGIRSLRRLFSAPVFNGSIFGSVIPPANVTSDEDLESFLRATGGTWLHGVGSASMSPKGARWGVVDPDFRVKGTKGLRVVDASVIPLLPSAHTQVPTYGFAEVASLMIAQQYA
ncbi:hypothetical protein NP233_g10130 [Leucocoprinus birnbaumii]|uniref:pyranose dehydrogenase (acceptor) n=1 Tax=Leucocoprinus birnbaumii TaxID=56174 RepID=A0AAD5VKX1_9AGAR|nr:hypothetical protein NP233_g10130 [Leucocoprinus birnbaumii]